MDLQPDRVVAGRFVLEKPLGKGGMGEVWAAKNSSTGRRVALKFLHADVAKSSHRERFFREARAAGALEHPNVCEVLDILEDDETPIMVLELLRGETLADKLMREKKLSAREAARIGAQVASAVGAAHARGIVHRDLKPANLFLERDNRIKVLDFGIAKLSVSDNPTDNLTATGSVLGTPAYMSPEQALGERDVDHRSDIWSLGIVLYECITGVLPTEAENMGQTIKKIVMRPVRPLRELAPEAPAALLELVGRMLERKRDRRVQDFREVLEVLSMAGEIECPPVLPPATGPAAEAPTTHDSGDQGFTDRGHESTALPEPATTIGTPRSGPSRGGASRSIATSAPATSRSRYAIAAAMAAVAAGGAWAFFREPPAGPTTTGLLHSAETPTAQTTSATAPPGRSSEPVMVTVPSMTEPVANATAQASATTEPSISARNPAAPRESARPPATASALTSSRVEALRDRR